MKGGERNGNPPVFLRRVADVVPGHPAQQDLVAGFGAGAAPWQLAAVSPQSPQVSDLQPPSASQHWSVLQPAALSQQASSAQHAWADLSVFWAVPARARLAAIPARTMMVRRAWISFMGFLMSLVCLSSDLQRSFICSNATRGETPPPFWVVSTNGVGYWLPLPLLWDVIPKENPPRCMAASFPGPDLLHAFGSVGRSAPPSDAAEGTAGTGALGVLFGVEISRR